ncbi:erythromycin esterase family protein [Paenibacillus agilis]|nr:erythromycin esterase family protein [Paenibacillus agilis]
MNTTMMQANNSNKVWRGRLKAMLLTVTMTATVMTAWLGPVSSVRAQSATAGAVVAQQGVASAQQVTVQPAAADKARTYPQAMADWTSWIKDNAYALDSIEPEKMEFGSGTIAKKEFDDLQMLKPLLQSKRIVYLGESTHGAAQFNSVKTRLIQFLHQEMGYNILAFESGLGDVAAAQGKLTSGTVEAAMKQSIFPVWWTEETLPLFQYMKDTQSQKQPLRMAGFDMQDYKFKVEDWLHDEALVKEFNEAEKQLREAGDDLKAYQKVKPNAIKTFEKVKQQVKPSAERLKKAYPDEPHIVKLMERALKVQIDVINEYNELSIRGQVDATQGKYDTMLQSFAWRDKMMAANLVWLAEEVYPTEKIIVWAHNDHIRKAHSEVEGTPFTVKFMGELMPEDYKKYSYVLGLYMASGETADNGGNKKDVVKFEPGSMESILSASNQPYTFVDLRYQREARGNSWMFEPVTTYSWGSMPESMNVREQYDGILLIDKVKAPKYVK